MKRRRRNENSNQLPFACITNCLSLILSSFIFNVSQSQSQWWVSVSEAPNLDTTERIETPSTTTSKKPKSSGLDRWWGV